MIFLVCFCWAEIDRFMAMMTLPVFFLLSPVHVLGYSKCIRCTLNKGGRQLLM